MEPILSQTELLQEQAARDIAHKVGMQQISRGYQWEYLGTGEGMTKRERALFDLSVALHMELHKPKVSPNDVHFGSVRNPMTPTAKELVLKCRPGAECAEGVLGETPEQYDYTIEWFEVEHERYLVLSDSFATEPAAWLSALESLPAEEVVRARWSDFYFRSKGMLYIGHHMSLDSFRAPTDDEALELAKKSIINELKAGEKEGKDE